MVGESDWKLTTLPLDAVAVKARVLFVKVAVAGAANATVCAVRVIWNVSVETSDAK
jgi:hypothetical protein